MSRRGLVLGTAVVGAGVVATVVVAALASGHEEPARFDRVSNAGVPLIDVSARDADVLTGGGGKPKLNVLGERAGFAFYSAPSLEGGRCYALGAASTGHIGLLLCPHALTRGQAAFPSRALPVLDLSGQIFSPGGATYLALTGFAADGVESVGLIDAAGEEHTATVADNFYARRGLPQRPAAALVAYDRTGREVFRRDLSKR